MAKKTKGKEKLSSIPRPTRKPTGPAAREAVASCKLDGETQVMPDLSHLAESLRPLAVPLSDLAFMVGNAVKHPEKQLGEIKASLKQFGQVEPLVVNRRKSPPEVIGGNGRLAGMLSLGWQFAAAVFVDLDDKAANTLSLALNRTSDGREWDRDALTKMMTELQDDAGKFAIDAGELDQMMADLAKAEKLFAEPEKPKAPEPDPEEEPAEPVKIGVVVECRDEEHQTAVVSLLATAGETARALVFTEKAFMAAGKGKKK